MTKRKMVVGAIALLLAGAALSQTADMLYTDKVAVGWGHVYKVVDTSNGVTCYVSQSQHSTHTGGISCVRNH